MIALVKKLENDIFAKKVLAVLSANVLLIVTAKFKIPAFFVDVSLQSMVVALLPLFLGPVMGFTVVSLYLLEGGLGYPVFQGTPERGLGLPYMLGTTGGYLVGFFLSQAIGLFVSYKDHLLRMLTGLVFAHAVIHFCGVSWLAYLMGYEKAMAIDSQFWPGILLKCVLSLGLLQGLRKSEIRKK